jgi:hypothetical protein
VAYKSENGKYVQINVKLWQDDEGKIHIVYDDGKQPGEHFHTTVNNRDNSVRSHPHLYNHMKAVLVRNGKWTIPPNASNIEEK